MAHPPSCRDVLLKTFKVCYNIKNSGGSLMSNIIHVFHQEEAPTFKFEKDEDTDLEFSYNYIDHPSQIQNFQKHCCDMVMLYSLDTELESHLINFIQNLKQIPVVVISKFHDLQRRLELIKNGIDEYFHIEEDVTYILFKLRNLLKRINFIQHLKKGSVLFHHLKIDFGLRQVYHGQKRINLTVKEFEMLQLFLSNPTVTLSKEEIFYHLWSKALFFSENVINVHIRNLRKKIELNDKQPKIIETVWGYGYKLGQGVIIED